MAESQRLREAIFHSIEQTSNELRVQQDATNFDFRKRHYEMKRAKEELEYQMKAVGEIFLVSLSVDCLYFRPGARSVTRNRILPTWRWLSRPRRILSSWPRLAWRTEPSDLTWSCAGTTPRMASPWRCRLWRTPSISLLSNWIIQGRPSPVQLVQFKLFLSGKLKLFLWFRETLTELEAHLHKLEEDHKNKQLALALDTRLVRII